MYVISNNKEGFMQGSTHKDFMVYAGSTDPNNIYYDDCGLETSEGHNCTQAFFDEGDLAIEDQHEQDGRMNSYFENLVPTHYGRI